MAHNIADFLLGYFDDALPVIDSESDVTVTTAPTQIIGSDARRWGLKMCNTGANIIALDPNGTISLTQALILLGPGQTVMLDPLNDLDLPTMQWWGISSGSGSTLHVMRQVLTGETVPPNA